MTFDDVRKLALTLEGVTEELWWGTAGFKVRGKGFARLREDGGTLVVGIDLEQREEVLAADPETYYITDHYRSAPYILVRLARVHPDVLRDLLRGARRLAASQSARARAPRRRW